MTALRRFGPALVLVMAALAAYANSFHGAFVFDDATLAGNVPADEDRSLGRILTGPRPVVDATLALNHALHGERVWGYHLVNFLIHLTSALLLFGIVRRTLLTERLRGRFGQAAIPLALSVALLWLVHPIQTQAVTYIIQRGESLMGMFYLLTLYAGMRAAEAAHRALADEDAGLAPTWQWLAVGACALGMGCKPVMATAPLVALLHDRVFQSGSFREALRRSKRMYAGLAATWAILAAIQIANPPGESAGFGMQAMTSWEYLRTQPGVILHYLRLSVWPWPLCLDYAWPVAHLTAREFVLPGAIIVVLLAATAWGLWRRPMLGFLGAWFFLILAPTSSFMPIADVCVEHRMYLPLAAVVAAVVIGAYALGAWLLTRCAVPRPVGVAMGVGIVSVAALVLASLTHLRNRDYASGEAIWQDVLRKQPSNARAYVNLGKLKRLAGRTDEALADYRRAIQISPDMPAAHYNIGNIYLERREPGRAAAEFSMALRLNPNYYQAHNNLGIALAQQGRTAQAMSEFQTALRIKPGYAQAHENLGLAYQLLNQSREAAEHFGAALAGDPFLVKSNRGLAWIRATSSDPDLRNGAEAVRLAERAIVAAGRRSPDLLDVLAAAYAEVGRFADAVATMQEALTAGEQSGGRDATVEMARLKAYQSGHPWRERQPIR